MDTINTSHLCPVCGYDLGFPPWRSESPSFEICPCCGIQFGYDDAAFGDPRKRQEIYAQWRNEWIAAGCPWRGQGIPAPPGWDPQKQLRKAGLQ